MDEQGTSSSLNVGRAHTDRPCPHGSSLVIPGNDCVAEVIVPRALPPLATADPGPSRFLLEWCGSDADIQPWLAWPLWLRWGGYSFSRSVSFDDHNR